MFKAIYKSIYNAGVEFAEGPLKNIVGKMSKDATTPEEKTGEAGLYALSVGSLLKTIGYVFLGLTAFVAVTNPVTAGAVAGYAATVALFGGGLIFGKGMEKGGDNMSGILTLSKDIRKSVVEGAKSDFRAWRAKKIGAPFTNAAADTAPVEAAPAAQTPAPAKQQPAAMENK